MPKFLTHNLTKYLFIFYQDYESDFEDDSGSENDEEEEDSEDDSVEDSSDVGTPDPEIAAVLQAMHEENNFESHLQRTFSMDVPDQDERSLSPEKRILKGMFAIIRKM